MINNPTVSVITAYFNRRENLAESVSSVLEQDYRDFEYIIVDDFSDDGTYEELKSIHNDKLHVLRNSSNIGFTRSLIKAISIAKGKYIALHGAGDISKPNRLAKLTLFMEADENLVLVGSRVENCDLVSDETEVHDPITSDSSVFRFTHGEIMMLRDAYHMVGGYYSWCRYGQFTNLARRLACVGRVDSINEVLYQRVKYCDGVSKSPKKFLYQVYYLELASELSRSAISDPDIERFIPAVNSKQVLLMALFQSVRKYGFVEIDETMQMAMRNHGLMLSVVLRPIIQRRLFSRFSMASLCLYYSLSFPKDTIRKLKDALNKSGIFR